VRATSKIGVEPGISRPPHWLDAERVRVYSWMILVIFGVVLIAWTAMSLPHLVDRRGKPLGYDFMTFWSAARLALAGSPAAAYDGDTIAALQHATVPFAPEIWFPWHYPPTFLLAVLPLGLLPYPAAALVFVSVGAVLWGLLARAVLPPAGWIVAAAAPAALINLLDGQNAFYTVALGGFALLLLERRPLVSGLLIGLLAIKPHLAVLFPLALLAEAQWRTIAAAAVTVLLFLGVTLPAFGIATWQAFLHDLPLTMALADTGAHPWSTMPSPHVFALSLGAPVLAGRVLQAACALLAAGCVWYAWRRRGAPFEAKAATLAAGSLLVSPYLFYYDLTWASLAVAWLALLGLRLGFRRGERELLLLVWAVPAIMQPIQILTGFQIGFPALLLLLIAATTRAAPRSRANPAAALP